MPFEDKTLSCRDCHQPFSFTAGEQEYYAAKQLQNEPKRCPNCRILLRVHETGQDPKLRGTLRRMPAITLVPFKPTGAKPVYCVPCLHARRYSLKVKDDDESTVRTEVHCEICGVATSVPFKPTGLKPVYCVLCLQVKRQASTQ